MARTGGVQTDGTYVEWVLVRGETVVRASTNRDEIVRIAAVARRVGARVAVFRTQTQGRRAWH